MKLQGTVFVLCGLIVGYFALELSTCCDRQIVLSPDEYKGDAISLSCHLDLLIDQIEANIC